ncbi:Histidine protein methyltransferase 1 homolog [Coccomyxa sp. Obi]|nr:Histidine protein methyltransferase 1 homolog [Coccomyxa sp. Obi]
MPAEEVVLSTQEAGNGRIPCGTGPVAVGCDVLTEVVEISPNVRFLKGRLSSRASSQLLQEEGLADSDLIPGKYEGGFKLWECAIDLARFMCQHFRIEDFDQHAYPQLPGLPRVLELGCGQGIPGILVLKAGAEVHFQDYNREVLMALTIPNVAANTVTADSNRQAEGHSFPRSRFFSGDWATLPTLLEREGLLGTYDMILSAETIYSLDSQQQLLSCIKQCLRPTTGQAWIAAKSYYFGVGGGTASFIRLVEKGSTFNVEAVDVINDGASNKREILRLTFRR